MPTITDIIDSCVAHHGFDPSGIYCQLTGKRIGSTPMEEFESVVNLVGCDSADEIADDIAIRVLASMRPSLKWNKFRAESMAQLRKSDPTEMLSFLLNRLFAPLNHRKIGIDNLLGTYADRIRGFQLLNEWGVTDATNTLLYMLLEVDAKWNLDTESAPFTAYDFFFDAATMEHRVEMVQAWYANRMIAWEKRLKAEEQMTKWYRFGNALAQPAFRDAFMESKPLSPTAIKKAEKDAEKQMFGDLLFEIMGEPNLAGETKRVPAPKPAPTFVPIRKMPLKFGVKRNG
jgi:hypothetical protein